MDPQEFLEELSRSVGDMEQAIDVCDAEERCSLKLCIRDVKAAMLTINRLIRDLNRIKRTPDIC